MPKKKEKIIVNKSEVRALIDQYYQTQKHRIMLGNQIFQLEEAGEMPSFLKEYHKQFYAIEKSIAKNIGDIYKQSEMYSWLKGVKGIGPILGCCLVSLIDIEKAQHASSVWKYCGLSPDSKREKGKKVDYNPFMKMTCWKIGSSFVKSKGKYRQIYDTSKAFYNAKFPNEVKEKNITKYTKGHKNNMAMRRTVKLFLADFWAEWRTLRGLPVSVPFAERIGVHIP